MAYFLIYFPYPAFVDLHYSPVVSHQPVHFHFHIGSLGVYSSGETLTDHLFQLFSIFNILVGHFIGAVELYVSPVAVGFPEVFLVCSTDSSVFAKNSCPLSVVQIHFRVWVIM